MKSLILVAVILQLVIIGIKTDGKYQFGDIIRFPRKCMEGVPLYSHYAIYVGPKSVVNVGQGDNDIFHHAGKVGKTKCKFGKLAKTRRKSSDTKDNYLDGIVPPEDIDPKMIKVRITQMEGKGCGKYDLRKNNCEHLATFVRYGDPLSVQRGTVGQLFLQKNTAKLKEMREKHAKEDVDADQFIDDIPSCEKYRPNK